MWLGGGRLFDFYKHAGDSALAWFGLLSIIARYCLGFSLACRPPPLVCFRGNLGIVSHVLRQLYLETLYLQYSIRVRTRTLVIVLQTKQKFYCNHGMVCFYKVAYHPGKNGKCIL